MQFQSLPFWWLMTTLIKAYKWIKIKVFKFLDISKSPTKYVLWIEFSNQGLKCHLHIFKTNRSSPYISEFMGCKKCMCACKNTTRDAYAKIDQINQNRKEYGSVWGRPVRPVCPKQPAKNTFLHPLCIKLTQILLDNINKVHYTQ